MISRIKKPLSILLAVMMIVGVFAALPLTANAETETLLTTITSNENGAVYSVSNRATLETSGKLEAGLICPEPEMYGWDNSSPRAIGSVTVKPADGYTITKVVFWSYQFTPMGGEYKYPLTDTTSPYTCYAKSSRTSLNEDMSGTTGRNIAKIEVYGYAAPTTYTVTWKNADGTTLETDTDVAEGTTPTYDGADPEKAEDEKYTYTFAGWSPEITAVTGDVTYTAQYMATFKGITSDQLYEGLMIDAGTPIKFLMMSTNQIYQGIELEVYLDDVQVKSLKVNPGSSTEPDRYYTPTKKCIVVSYTVLRGQTAIHTLYLKSLNTVTWKNGDDVLETDNDVAFGATPTYDGTTPEKAEDESNTYTFAGWSPAVAPVTEDVTYTAQFDATPKTPAATASYVKVTSEPQDWSGDYLIVYEDEDDGNKAFNGSADGLNSAGNYIDVTISGGEIESNAATDAAKVTIAQIDGGYSIATANGMYIGRRSNSNGLDSSSSSDFVNTISLDNGGNAVIVSSNAYLRFNTSWNNIGGFRYYQSSSYTKQKSVQLYKLTGGSAPATYTVTWKNGDTVLETDTDVAEGTTPTYDGETPYKADGANCIYTFSGWTPAVAPVTEDVTYTAQFTESEKPEAIKDCNNKYGDFRLYSNVPIVSFSNVNDLLTGAIIPITYGDSNTMIPVQDAKGYSYKFYDQTGTEIQAQITSSSSAPGSNYEFSDDVTVYTNVINFTRPAGCTAIYIVATAPEPAPVEIFTQHSITLGGDIGVNFYLDSAVLDTYTGTKTVKFTCDGEETTVDVPATPTADGYKVTRNVVAAQMAHTITATLYVDGELVDTDEYSVREYAEKVFANPAEYDSEKPVQLAALAQALLNYGAMAQTVFATSLNEHPALANTSVGDNGYAAVTADMIAAAIKDEASDLNAVAAQLGAKYYTSSLIYLSKNTLRVYFTPTSYPGEIPNAGAYDGNLSGYYYYVDHANIPAAELDNQQTFTVGGTTFTFSALDYAKAVVDSTKMEPEQQNLAKALYLYNQTANDYFDVAHDHTPGEPVHVSGTPATCSAAGSYYEVTYCTKCGEEVSRVAKTIDKLAHTIVAVAEVPATTEADGVAAHYECSVCHKLFSDAEGNNETTAEALVIPQIVENVVDLSTLTKGYEAQDGDVLINALKGQKYIRIADGATIKLRNANITSLNNSSGVKIAGLTLLGDATIILEGTNTIRGGYEYCPGIHVPEGKTLTIDGTGSLDVSSNGRGFGCGIGSNDGTNCGNIVINGGNITAYAGTAAGIGAKSGSSCGNITINGGTVNATSGDYGAGIGSTLYGNSICGDITINGGIVNATAKYQGAGIGSGVSANCGNITITGGIVTAIGGENGAGIGSGERVSICGNILITGGTVTAKGGENAAGIGSGYTNSSCGTITITDTVTQVTATKGSSASNSIGAGSNSTCGDVTIADGANVTQN